MISDTPVWYQTPDWLGYQNIQERVKGNVQYVFNFEQAKRLEKD